jgi:membrane-associated phospholipid phosphatase
METYYEIGIRIIGYLQSLGEWLLNPMEFFSFLGSAQFFLLVMPFLYWCLDAGLAKRVGIILLLGNSLNSILKMAWHSPRPFWYTREVNAYAFESTFGNPSGHAQNAVAVWGILATAYRRNWGVWLAILVVFLIGLSRVYLAVHFPQDVLVGWLIGFLVLWLYLRLEPPVGKRLRKFGLSTQILLIFVVSLAIIAVGWLVRTSLNDWVLPVEWIENAHTAFPDEEIDPLSLEGLLTSTGALFGFAAGIVWIEARGGMDVSGAWWRRGLRFTIGVAGVIIIWAGLGSLFPESETPVAYVLRYLRYALVGVWISALAPLIFIKSGLAEKKRYVKA